MPASPTANIKPANLMVRDGVILVIDVAFAELRPTPWRQAVDLANMMLCLALRSNAQQVYERARLQFSVEEITEGFAAARGLALPSQLRRALPVRRPRSSTVSSCGFSLSGRGRSRSSAGPPAESSLWAAFVVLLFLFCVNFTKLFTNDDASRTSSSVDSIDCTDERYLEQLWIEAQSVQSATLVPCVASLPVGWSLGNVYANSGRSGFTIDHDRADRTHSR